MQSKTVSEATQLVNTVVSGGYCVGCGACASVVDSPLEMGMDNYGRFQATVKSDMSTSQANTGVLSVCPFSNTVPNEDEIAKELFGQDSTYHNRIGYHLATYAGFVAEEKFRERGSSGGMGTWILTELFQNGLIDGAIHVQQHQPSANNAKLFQFQISSSIDEIRTGAKSRYYPVEMSEVLNLVRQTPGRYAIVGVPCFIKAVRLLAKQDPVIQERIHYCIGLVCGHLKSARFADMFAWQCGIEPGNLLSIDFRKKIDGQNANKYGVEVVGLKNDEKVTVVKSNYEFYGYLWGHGFFKYQACDYCDDVVSETADVTVGDAWLPKYVEDSQGTNVVVVRNSLIKNLIDNAMRSGRLHLEEISADDVARSQDAGLRHRREGLAYRLYLKDQAGLWRPKKRVQAQHQHLDRQLKKVHELRVLLANQSHIAFQKAIENKSFDVFRNVMEPLVKAYNALYNQPAWKQKIARIKTYVKRLKSFSLS